jgi:NDP-sugar pyrophosphorylase family protein
VEAIILAGGKAERLGEAARGRPKALVDIGGRPLIAYQLASLATVGVDRVIISCAAGAGELFADLSGGELEIVEEPEPLGRGGGLRYAAARRRESGPLYALNGDELVDVDFRALLAQHERTGPAATITVAQVRSPFGVVELDEDVVLGFREAPLLPEWVSCGIYVLDEEALERLPERGDHETSTFPELAAERRLRAFRHEGVWLTVNTPKDLRRAEEYVAEHPHWLQA